MGHSNSIILGVFESQDYKHGWKETHIYNLEEAEEMPCSHGFEMEILYVHMKSLHVCVEDYIYLSISTYKIQ